MNTKSHPTLIAFAVLLIAACGTGKSQESQPGTPLKKERKVYSETMIGQWVYDIPFMGKEFDRLKANLLAYVKRKNPKFQPTPDFNQRLDALLKKDATLERYNKTKLDCAASGLCKMSGASGEHLLKYGFGSDLDALILSDTTAQGQATRFAGFKPSLNAFTFEEKMRGPGVDTTFTVIHRFIRKK